MKTTWIIGLVAVSSLVGQSEIPRGFNFDLELTQGFRAQRIADSRPYVGSITLVPGYCLLNNRLNAGLAVSVYYTNPKFALAAGPRLAWRVAAPASDLGTLTEWHIFGEAAIGTRDLVFAGGGLLFDTDVLNFAIHFKRELDSKDWWVMASTGFTLDNLLGF